MKYVIISVRFTSDYSLENRIITGYINLVT